MTAALAYVIAQNPVPFKVLLGIENRDKIMEVQLEYCSEGNRYDISISTMKKIVVIEAKVGFEQDERQVKRYLKQLKIDNSLPVSMVLLDNGSFYGSTFKQKLPKRTKVHFREWSEVHSILKKIAFSKKEKRRNPSACFLVEELMNYLEVGGMSSEERKEVYCRDLSGESMVLFFKHHLYKSNPKFFKSAKGNLYFAPYFTWNATQDAYEYMLDIGEGISYVAPILDIRVLKRNEIKDYLISEKHENAKQAAKMILGQTRLGEIMVVRLGRPSRLFLTPINKKKLKAGTGAMPSRSFTFTNLLEAAIRN